MPWLHIMVIMLPNIISGHIPWSYWLKLTPFPMILVFWPLRVNVEEFHGFNFGHYQNLLGNSSHRDKCAYSYCLTSNFNHSHFYRMDEDIIKILCQVYHLCNQSIILGSFFLGWPPCCVHCSLSYFWALFCFILSYHPRRAMFTKNIWMVCIITLCRCTPISHMWSLPHHIPRYEYTKVDALIALMNCKNIYPTLRPYVNENSFFAKNHAPS